MIQTHPSFLSPSTCSAGLAVISYPQSTSFENRTVEISPKPFGFVLGEQARNLFTFFYSKLPTLSLPVAQASNFCKTPEGLEGCDKTHVKYLPQKRICVLTTECPRESDELPAKFNSALFQPEAEMTYENHDGTLAFRREIIPIVTQNNYIELEEKIAKIDEQLTDPSVDDFAREMLEDKREWLVNEALEVRNEVISRLYQIGSW
jgi:hypothetical protein